MTSVTIPDGVMTIDDNAFNGCSGLTTVTIGRNVTSISYFAFYQCHSLAEIYSLNPIAPTLSGWATCFYEVNPDIPVHVPCGNDSYSLQWAYFTNIIGEYPPSFNTSKNFDLMGEVQVLKAADCQDLTAVVQAVPADGYAVTLYDLNGRVIEQRAESGEWRTESRERRVFDVPASGAYLVKIGNLPARKVIVVR